MIENRRPKRTMQQVLAETEALIKQRLSLSHRSAVVLALPDPAIVASAHSLSSEDEATAWLAGWHGRVEGCSLDEIARSYPDLAGYWVDAILGWRDARRHLPLRQRVSRW